MKIKNYNYLLAIILMLLSHICLAQTDTSITVSEEVTMEEIMAFVIDLPPLETLIEIAIEESELMKSKEGIIKVKEHELLRIKNDWLDIVSFQGNIGYGNGLLGVNQSNLTSDVITNTNSIRFNLGVLVNLSPAYWVERKHEINIRKGHLAYAEAMKNDAKTFIAERVTLAYLQLEYYRDIFRQTSAAYELNRSTLKLSQKKFLEGDIDISLYNDIQLKNNKIQLEVENYKFNLKRSYHDLVLLIKGNFKAE